MALNYQDVIRDVHDPVNHALQISGTIQAAGQATVSLLGAPTVMVGTPTLFAVVNTSAAGVGNSIVTINPRVDYIGLMSVSGNVNISNPTLYAVVNTSAAGVGNSIVTVANPDFGINAGVNSIGFATVNQVNQPALVASSANIGSVSILGGVLNTVSAVTDITNPIAIKGNVTLSDSKGFIGLTSIQGNVNLNAGINNIGFATVAVSTPTLYAVVNTGAVGTTNSMVTINPRTDYFGLVSVSGNVAVSSLPALTAGAAFVGIVTVANPSSFTGNVTLDAGSLTGIKGNVTLSGPLPTGTLNIGSVSILGGTVGVSSIPALAAGVNSIGFASVTPVMAWPDPKTYIGLVTITGSLAAASGNVTITDGKTFIGSVSVTGNVGLNAGVAGIGFATVNVVNQPALVASSAFIGLVTVANTVPVTGTFWQATQPVSGTIAATQSGTWDEVGINDSGNSITIDGNVGILGNVTITDSKGYIGLTSVSGSVGLIASTLNIGSVSVLGGGIGINAGLNNIGFATVAVSTPTLYAVVNTGAAGVQNSMVTINPRTDYFGLVSVSGNVAVSSLPATPAGANYIGLVSVKGTVGSFLTGLGSDGAGTISLDISGDGAGSSTTPDIVLPTGGFQMVYTGSAWDRTRSVNAANATTGTGLLGAGILGFDGTNYRRVSTDTGGQIKLGDPKTYIGLVTVGHTVTVAAHSLTASTLNIGSVSVLGGTINATLQSSTLNVGSVSILGGKIVNDTSTLNIGSVSVLGGVINANLNSGTLNIGSVSILGGTIKLAEPNVFIGLTTSVNGAGTQFIGLVTAWARNAGTTKTLISLPVGLGNNSLATVAVPTNANKVNVTQLILNSNVTTEIAIKSGATYLTGNASLGVTLFPGGGFVMNGAPDSPAWIGLPSGAMIVEKRDSGGTVSKIGGGVIYFDET